ncbi:TetR/AcrR family transcriptional regulator [Neptuniibacter sp. QD37_11]|uniref:TetR/AcrR family transcriptional regulator n=1 Tax=Neptuniibacter sp. QD37_11 TaxID=3398209 RepID=UPI0039F4A682
MGNQKYTEERLCEVIGVFLQYGYNKTSLEMIAKALDVSRQTLYLRHGNKQQLFKDAINYCFNLNYESSKELMRQPVSKELYVQLFDGWCGQYVELFQTSPYAEEMLTAGQTHAKEIIQAHTERFLDALSCHLIKGGYENPEELAEVIYWACKGFARYAETRAEYVVQLERFMDAIL